MRTIEWETKGFPRTPIPSSATTREMPFLPVDNRPYRQGDGPSPGKAAPDAREEYREPNS
jgi:hypothetical protein